MRQLAADLLTASVADKDRAISMLNDLSFFIEHHCVLLRAGVLANLMQAMESDALSPQASMLAFDAR